MKDLYISKGVMQSLGIISGNFPNVEAAGSARTCESGEDGAGQGETSETCPGGCRKRGPAPPLPDRLPFQPSEENI